MLIVTQSDRCQAFIQYLSVWLSDVNHHAVQPLIKSKGAKRMVLDKITVIPKYCSENNNGMEWRHV